MPTSKLTRAAAGAAAAILLTAGAGAALAADPTDAILAAAAKITAEYDLPAGLLLAVAETESDFDPSCRTGRCYGLMQINSVYAAEFARAAGMEDYDLFDAADSLRIAGWMLGDYRDRYEGDIHMWLMAYNLGEYGALTKRRDGVQTTSYSRKVVGRMERWAEVGLPEPPAVTETAPAATETTATETGTVPADIRAYVTGVWQRLREVLFR